ncbi:hypothetical protein GCM10027167_40670 [Nocardia heshunensis]
MNPLARLWLPPLLACTPATPTVTAPNRAMSPMIVNISRTCPLLPGPNPRNGGLPVSLGGFVDVRRAAFE